MSEAVAAEETDDQHVGRTIKTRHLDALRDLQKNESDRLQRIKNDPSRKLSRRNEPNGVDINRGAESTEDSLPVKQVWAGALKASKLTVGKRLAVTRRDLLSHYQPVGTGYVKSKIGQWEKLIVLIESTREQVDTTVRAGCQRMNQIVANSPPPKTATSPYVEAKNEFRLLCSDHPEMFISGSTQAYQRNELDLKSVALLEELILANNGKPMALSCGVYSDEETVEQPIDITAVAIIANGILFVALTIEVSAGHEADLNAYGVKKVKIFTAEGSVNVLEKLLEVVPKEGSLLSVPPSFSVESRDSTLDMDLDLEFQRTEGTPPSPAPKSRKNILSSEEESDDDGGSDSSEDSEGEEDLALYLVEAGNLSKPTGINCDSATDSGVKGSRLDYNISTHSQGTNTSLYNMGFQTKSILSSETGSESDASTLPDSSSRRIRMFDLQEVRGVVSSSNSLVLQRSSDAVAFTGTLQSAITVQALDAKLLIVGNTAFEWTRAAAASGWMCKQPVRSYSSGRATTEGEKESWRFLRLRDTVLRYDTADTLSISHSGSMSPVIASKCAEGPDSEEHPQTHPAPAAAAGRLHVLEKGAHNTNNPVPSLMPEPLFTPCVGFTASIPDTPTSVPVSGSISSHISSITDKLADRLFNKTPARQMNSLGTGTPGWPQNTPSRARGDTLAAVMGAFSGYGNATVKKDKDPPTQSSGELLITRNSIVTLGKKSNPFITVTTPKETISIRYEHMNPPPAMPFSPLGSGFLEEAVPSAAVRSTVHALWMREISRAIAQQGKKPVLLAKHRVESKWSHESPGFVCVAMDAAVEVMPLTTERAADYKEPSHPLEICAEPSNTVSDLKFTHAALYSLRTIKHNTRMRTKSALVAGSGNGVGNGSGTESRRGSKGRMPSVVLGDFSSAATRTLEGGCNPGAGGEDTDVDKAEGSRTQIPVTAEGSGSGTGAGLISNPTGISDVCSTEMGVVNMAYYVSLGFVSSTGESGSTNLIEVLNEKRTSNLGTELTCMCQCGDSLIFGGAHGFVGMGVAIPHRNEDREGDSGDGVAVMCVFPSSSPCTSPTDCSDPSDSVEGPGGGEGADIANKDCSPYLTTTSTSSHSSTTDYNEMMIGRRRKSLQKEANLPVPVSTYPPSDTSVLRLRGHGYYTNITCLAVSPGSLESDDGECLYAAGDDTGGVSLWRIFPKTSQNVPQEQSSDEEKYEEQKREEPSQESRLQCFLNINCLLRTGSPDSPVPGVQREDEKVITLKFLPNSELLLIGTNKRLLLIVIGAHTGTHPESGIDEPNINIWKSSTQVPIGPFSPTARQQHLSHWLSHSPSPYKKSFPILKGQKCADMTFLSYVELDRVPAHCEGIFSMSVGGDPGTDGVNGAGDIGVYRDGDGLLGRQSTILWKVVVEKEIARLIKSDKYGRHGNVIVVPRQTASSSADLRPSNSAVSKEEREKEKNVSIFSMPSLQTFFNPPSHSSTPGEMTPRSPTKAELNLNLKQEKEMSERKGKRNSASFKNNFDVDLDDVSDCRVYRFNWTDEMFQTAFQGLKTIPLSALQDHLSKYY